jgi:prepilin-type N-terminal cleavage/methylation domain-containing protein
MSPRCHGIVRIRTARSTSSGVLLFRPGHAFSLIELLTAMAVLALILVLLVQVVNGILQSTQAQSQQMDSVAEARRMLDVIETDLSQAVITESATILLRLAGDSRELAFLADRRGPTAGHRLLAVRYDQAKDTQFQRSYGSVGFTEADLLAAAVEAPVSSSVLANGILAFDIRFLGESGEHVFADASSAAWTTASYNGFATPGGWRALITDSPSFARELPERIHSLQIWVAAIDEQNLGIIDPAGIRTIFGADPSAWRENVDQSESLPARVKSAIRILSKTIPLS